MFVSVIIPTIGRSTLPLAVASVCQQPTFPDDAEIIIVNISGRTLHVPGWQPPREVTILDTVQRDRCIARNTGAAVARGDYLIFLDDDDWLLEGALPHLRALAQQRPDAAWLYGGLHIVDDAGQRLGEAQARVEGACLGPILGGAWAPLQASMIKAETFFAVGGFDPEIVGTEDLDLSRRVALVGDFATTTHPIGCLLRGRSWNTSTDYERAPWDTLRSREKVISDPRSFSRLATSTREAYWRGRILRVYLSLVRFHARQNRYWLAFGRSLAACRWIAVSGKHLLSTAMWKGLRSDHPPNTLHAIMKDLNRRQPGDDSVGG
jgi:glycosyltransferase involved in cell wall biosynthesis